MSPAVLQLALFCMQFADSAGNIAGGALIQTNTLLFCTLRLFSVFREILEGLGLFHVKHMPTVILHYLKG